MVYLDTSAAVPIFVPEPASEAIAEWVEANVEPLVSSDWIVTEFASALSIKVRNGEIDTRQAKAARDGFREFCRSGLRLVPLTRSMFDVAAELAANAKSGLRSGDSLHLAAAVEIGADAIMTVDKVLAKNARARGLVVVEF
jgi:hypothetical protein